MLHQFDQHGAPLMRKGLATTSLILGILSVLTLGLGVIGAILGIVLGMVALSKIRTDPHLYGRKNFAVGGIVLSASGLLLGIGYGSAVFYRHTAQRKANESKTVAAPQTLKNAQNQYAASHQRDYATPDQLVGAGLIDNRFIGDSPVVDGYVFRFKVVARTQKHGVFLFHQCRSANPYGPEGNWDETLLYRFKRQHHPRQLPKTCGISRSAIIDSPTCLMA